MREVLRRQGGAVLARAAANERSDTGAEVIDWHKREREDGKESQAQHAQTSQRLLPLAAIRHKLQGKPEERRTKEVEAEPVEGGKKEEKHRCSFRRSEAPRGLSRLVVRGGVISTHADGQLYC